MIGLNQVQRALTSSKENLLVFIMNDQETIELNKHLVGYCRQFGVHNYLMPKFLKKGCAELFGVKRLSCFALRVEDDVKREKLIKELSEFDNHLDGRETLGEHRFVEESLFKTCFIKKWQVELKK